MIGNKMIEKTSRRNFAMMCPEIPHSHIEKAFLLEAGIKRRIPINVYSVPKKKCTLFNVEYFEN